MRRDIRWELGASKAGDLLIELDATATGADSERLTAPVAGTVQQLQLHTIGEVVEPAKPLMAIVPRDAGIEIEVETLHKDEESWSK